MAGDVQVHAVNGSENRAMTVVVADKSYKAGDLRQIIPSVGKAAMTIDTQRSFHWYDVAIRVESFHEFEQRFAGRVETGESSFSDPAI